MVTTQKDKIKEFFGDFYTIFIMTLLFPLFFLLWIASLIKGKNLMMEEGEGWE